MEEREEPEPMRRELTEISTSIVPDRCLQSLVHAGSRNNDGSLNNDGTLANLSAD
jgi:hypothetical protein